MTHIIKNLQKINQEKYFIQILNETYNLYTKYGPRSSKKVDYFHLQIKKILNNILPKEKKYDIKLELNVPSCNSTKKKRCDIVVTKNEVPYIVFPIKIIMTNYKQNKNNYWENLTGEITHIKWMNENINIIPINIFMNKIPYLKSNKEIKKFESITIKDLDNYNKLIEHNLCYDVINYIVEIEHTNKIGDIFEENPNIKKFSNNTKYKTFESILCDLL